MSKENSHHYITLKLDQIKSMIPKILLLSFYFYYLKSKLIYKKIYI